MKRPLRQTKITDFFAQQIAIENTAAKGAEGGGRTHGQSATRVEVKEETKKSVEERPKVDVCTALSSAKLSNYERAVLLATVKYPYLSSTSPWHSVGILRLFEDVKKLVETTWPTFSKILDLLRTLRVITIVDGVVVNYNLDVLTRDCVAKLSQQK